MDAKTMTAADCRRRAVEMIREAGYTGSSDATRDRHIATAAVWAELAKTAPAATSAALSETTED